MVVPGRRIWCEPVSLLGGINWLPTHTEIGVAPIVLRKRIDHRNRIVRHAGIEVFAVARIDAGFEAPGEQETVPMRQAVTGHE